VFSSEVGIVRFDGVFNVGQGQAAVWLVVQRLRLHAAKHRRAAAFPAVGVRHLADDVFVAALAVAEDSAEVALRAGGHKHRGLKPQQVGYLGLQGIDARVVTKHVVTQRRRVHGRPHGCGRLGDGVAAQIDDCLVNHLLVCCFFGHIGL
jgi:hypothetical protein